MRTFSYLVFLSFLVSASYSNSATRSLSLDLTGGNNQFFESALSFHSTRDKMDWGLGVQNTRFAGKSTNRSLSVDLGWDLGNTHTLNFALGFANSEDNLKSRSFRAGWGYDLAQMWKSSLQTRFGLAIENTRYIDTRDSEAFAQSGFTLSLDQDINSHWLFGFSYTGYGVNETSRSTAIRLFNQTFGEHPLVNVAAGVLKSAVSAYVSWIMTEDYKFDLSFSNATPFDSSTDASLTSTLGFSAILDDHWQLSTTGSNTSQGSSTNGTLGFQLGYTF